MQIKFIGVDMQNKYKLSILMPLYNNESFVGEALDSIFSQKTNFEYKIIIINDASTDNSLYVAKEYQKKHKNIQIIENEKNLKLLKTIFKAYAILDTEYFCVLDPDDYWTDENKLQEAVDFLDKNLDYTIYFTNNEVITNDGANSMYVKVDVDNYTFDFNDHLQGRSCLGCTLGSVFRNVIFKNGIPEKIQNCLDNYNCESFRGDTFRNLIHLKEGKAFFRNKSTAVYRYNCNGLWSSLKKDRQNLLNANFNYIFWRLFDKKYSEYFLNNVFLLLNNVDLNSDFEKEEIREIANLQKELCLFLAINLQQKNSVISTLQQEMTKISNNLTAAFSEKKTINEEKTENAKIVHIMFNDKFNKPFVDFLNKNFNPDEHLILCKRWFNNDTMPFPTGGNVIEIKTLKNINLSNYQKIICHSLFDDELVDLLYNQPELLKKAYWAMWGGDLYGAPRDEKNDYVRENFKAYINKTDEKFARNKYNIKGKFYDGVYAFPISKEMLDKTVKKDKTYLQIQVNNSCDESTLEILDILSKFKDENIIVKTILSYGSLTFKESIIQKGKNIFGEKFEYIEEFFPADKYAQHLMDNDILVLNQNRQQGFGNIISSLYLGKKVFIKSNISTSKYLNDQDIKIFATEDIAKMSFCEFIRYNENETAKKNVKKYFDEKYLVSLWAKIFDDNIILDNNEPKNKKEGQLC